MNAKQYARAIARLGLSQAKAGEFLGLSPRQSRRFIAGDARVPHACAALLAVMLHKGLTVADVEAMASKPVPAS